MDNQSSLGKPAFQDWPLLKEFEKNHLKEKISKRTEEEIRKFFIRIKENNELSEDEKYEYINDISGYGKKFFLLSLYFLDLDFKESMKYYGFTDLERFFDFFCKLMPRCMDEICYFHDAQFDYILA